MPESMLCGLATKSIWAFEGFRALSTSSDPIMAQSCDAVMLTKSDRESTANCGFHGWRFYQNEFWK
jgi:hypothetical protein